ncbi:interferon-induced helicase C domain-containing protein 1-like isoform X2, partial [Biomphalaria pfeifferi]
MHDQTATLHDQSATLHDQTATQHDRTSNLQGQTAWLHDQTATLHDQTATLHDQTATPEFFDYVLSDMWTGATSLRVVGGELLALLLAAITDLEVYRKINPHELRANLNSRRLCQSRDDEASEMVYEKLGVELIYYEKAEISNLPLEIVEQRDPLASPKTQVLPREVVHLPSVEVYSIDLDSRSKIGYLLCCQNIMEDIEDLKIIISSLRDVFMEYLRPDVLNILASKSERLNLSFKSQIEKYQEESKEQQKGLSKLLDDILEDDNFLLDFIQILHQDSYNSGESLFIASQLEDGKEVQIGQSISLILLLMNNDCVLQLACQDIYDIIQKLVAYNFIRTHDYEQLQCKKYKPLHLFLEMFRSIKHYEPKWFLTFICLLKEKKPNVFDLNSNAKGWKKTESSSVDMLEDLKNITAIHKDVNIPDNESVVSSLSSLSTSSESCSIYSEESESNWTGISTPFFVLQEKNLRSKVVHPDIWKDLDSLGILDFTQIICDDFSEGCTDLERDSDCSLSQTEESGVLALKDYQLELTEHAVKGKNTIIYAPTGSGKTIVAIYIILKHLERRRNKKPVAFFATTIPLVKQQCSWITKYLKDKYKVLQVTSENDYSMSLNMILSGYDVVVMTPKILENHFRKSYLHISDFSLLVFDECHHTHKKEPYLNLMSFYLKAKKQSSQEESKVNLPQIIGLTASISIGNAKTFEEAVKNILKVCANLDAEKVSIVVKYEAQLKADVNEPEE